MSQSNKYATTQGTHKKIQIAHRRSPSELTNLMIEQFTLQRQLELVQQQQQQILAQHGSQITPPALLPPPGNPQYGQNQGKGHSRQGSASFEHKRTGSHGGNGFQGHSRRQSLQLNDAMKAAAEEQARRAIGDDLMSPVKQPQFERAHRRSQSGMSPQRNFQFPPKPQTPANGQASGQPAGSLQFSSGSQNNLLQPPQIVTDAGSPSHARSGSRSYDNSGINSNWRTVSRSPSHHKSPSVSTLEPPPVFQPSHKHRNSGSSFQQVGASPGNFQQQQQPGGRKSLFAPYLPQSSVPELIAEGRLVAGTLRVNKKNRSDAYVSTDGLLDADIFICGSKDRNRALEGDLVAVELLVVDEVWGSKKEKEEKKRRKDAVATNDDYHNDASTGTESISRGGSVKRKGSLKQRPTQKKNDDVEVEGQSLLLVEEEEINDEYKPLYAGHVVAVLDRIPGQLFSGTLGLLRPSQQQSDKTPERPKIVWFKPTDKKVPLIAIPTEQAPSDFVENADKYAGQLFVASIKRWPITSLHPFGTLISQLGPINHPQTEIDAILRDNNFLLDEYVDEEGKPRNLDWTTVDNFESRKCFNDVIAISETGDYSDLAFSVTKSHDTIQLGIHVADVTAFISEGSSLDRRARKRSTGVFLPQQKNFLLPESLIEEISLKADKKSPTLSVVFTIGGNFEILDTWFGESCVVPSEFITYDKFENPTLSVLAREFKRQRLHDNNAELLPTLSLLKLLDDEKMKLSLNIFDTNTAMNVVDELSYKANGAVAKFLVDNVGDKAFLRRQSTPMLTKYESFKKRVSNYDVDLDYDNLITSISQIKDTSKRQAVEILLYKSLNRARYTVAGKVETGDMSHFTLNMSLYTHFTAPLRRYADHVVHRQLRSVVGNVSTRDDLDNLKITTEFCNFKKDCADHAQEQAVHSLLCKTINELSGQSGQLLTMATVIQVYESAFDVFIPELGIEKRVHGDQLPLAKAEYDNVGKVLELYWRAGVDAATFVPADEREPQSYRNSIKNKFKSASMEIATLQQQKQEVSDELADELSKLKIELPEFSRLVGDSDADTGALEPYISKCVVRTTESEYIQEIRELEQVPVLVRAEVGMALPCLSVRALNPFLKSDYT